MRVGLLGAAILAACNSGGGSAIDAGADASPDARLCVPGPFLGPEPCSGFGPATTDDATLSAANGELTITLGTSTDGAVGGCGPSAGEISPNGVQSLRVQQIATGPGSETALEAQFGVTWLGIVVSDGMLSTGAAQPIAFDPVAMRYWRLRTSSAYQLVSEYSADGATWTFISAAGGKNGFGHTRVRASRPSAATGSEVAVFGEDCTE